ncbi:MAG: hypothetical protein BWY87_01123 [Deltaproteobacteria bacterium ADurb.Bin510]|nr:MAG: hypothetical protein BWY87_01123 [Deltaproteobacteria bacterium ADurb.Bin510]
MLFRHHSACSCMLVLLLVAAALVLAPRAALADPPSEVRLAYAGQSLKVEITHASPLPSRHYISRVEIRLDGKSVSVNNYTSQPRQQPFSYVYQLAAAPGARIEVRVGCNIFGSKTASLVVP